MAKSFGQQIEEQAKELMKLRERQIRGAAVACFGHIITSSPVDTGRFRSNWFCSGAEGSNEVTKVVISAGSVLEAMTSKVVSLKDWSIFILTNNLPYSEVIEYGGYPDPVQFGSWNKKLKKFEILSLAGYSRQAPQGVVRVAIAQTEQNLERLP